MASKSSRSVRSLPILFFLGILAVATFLLFAPSLTSEFSYDSRGQILIGDFIHQPANFSDVLTFRVMDRDVLDFNRPVQLASLMTDSLLWGKNPFGYHLTNILLHVIATGLTFLLICHILQIGRARQMTANVWPYFPAFLATLLFAVHPLVSEAVCEPSNRKDILATLFGLGALLVVTGHSFSNRRGDVLRLLLCFFLTLLSIGTKEVGVAVPAIIFFYWILFRRLEPKGFWILAFTGSTLVATGFLIARFSLAHQKSEIFLAAPSYLGGSLGQALLLQPRILVLYLTNILWPPNLCADYTLYSVRFFPLLLSLILLAATSVLLAWWCTKDRRTCFGVGIIGAALLPVCNLVPIYNPAADRYLYLPLIGVAVLVATGLDHPWLAQKSFRRNCTLLLVLGVAAVLSQLTLKREWVWSSPLRLWQDTLERNPQSFQARIGYPEALLRVGRLQEACNEYEATLRTPYRETPAVWVGYALTLNRMGDRKNAEEAAQKALSLKPDLVDTDKMVRTMQYDRNFAEEFAKLAMSTSKIPSSSP
jgi:tetratricopeptide (TPR) repeat protein